MAWVEGVASAVPPLVTSRATSGQPSSRTSLSLVLAINHWVSDGKSESPATFSTMDAMEYGTDVQPAKGRVDAASVFCRFVPSIHWPLGLHAGTPRVMLAAPVIRLPP